MSDEKTEDASPERLRDARRKGQAPRSQEWSSAWSLIFVLGALAWIAQPLWDGLRQGVILNLSNLTADRPGYLLAEAAWKCVAALLVASLVGSILAQWFSAGWLWTFHPIQPDINRLNPVQNGQRFFSSKILMDAFKLAMKVLGSLWITYKYVNQRLLPDAGAGVTVAQFTSHFWDWLGNLGLLYLLVGSLDFLYQRWDFKRGLRMSKDEVKREHRQQDGDPYRKGRVRAFGQKLMKSRSLAGVEKASVIITNPTHLAVALQFNFQMGAPKVVAKGADHVAMAIRKLAKKHGVPIVEDRPLARALFPLEVDDTIPVDLFRPVAEILVAVAKAAEEQKDAW